MPETPLILCALNAAAGSGVALQRWPKVAALLDAFHIAYDLLDGRQVPLDEQVFRRLGEAGPGRYAAVAGIGGDGTHSAVINALMRHREARPDAGLPPYVLIPLGTGNNMAKSFGLTARENFFIGDLRRAVAAIRYGADYWLDLGCFDGRYFANSLTLGLDSAILQEHNRRKRGLAGWPLLGRVLRGNLLYTWCLGLRFWRQQPLDARIEIDGRAWSDGPLFNLVINNTRIYGGEFALCPDAFANDGLLDIVAFRGRGDYVARYFMALRTQPRRIQELSEQRSRTVSQAHGERIEVRLARPEPVQCDGEELAPRDRLSIRVAPRALRLKLPAEAP
mgnify:CR=1 FL=1